MDLLQLSGVEQLQRSDGNIIRYDSAIRDRLKLAMPSLLQEGVLSENEIAAIKFIAAQPLRNDKQFITYQTLELALDCRRESIVKRFLSLKRKGIVEFKPFDKTSCQKGLARCQCIELVSMERITDAVLNLQTSRDNNRISMQRRKQSELREEILRLNNLPPEAYVKPEELKSALMPRGFHVFETLAVDKGVRTKSNVAQYRSNNVTTVIETTSIDDVFTIEDIQPLYCLISITIMSWYNCIEYFRAKNELPPNRLYCEVIQILKMMGKSGGGTQYPDTQASMARIIGTVFNSIKGETLFEDALGGNLNEMTSFQFFQVSKTVYHTRDKISIVYDPRLDGQRIKSDAYGYELTWEENLYNTLLTEETFFNIPISILSARSYVFLLYMKLRYRMSRRQAPVSYTIEDVYNMLLAHRGKTETKLSTFRETLFTDLQAYKEKHNKDLELEPDTDEKATFDIAGFRLLVSHSDGRISAMAVGLDHARMVRLSGAAATSDGMSIKKTGKKAAPQSVNKMLDTVERIAAKIKAMGEDLPLDLTFRLSKIKITPPRRQGGKLIFRHPTVVNKSVEFCAYSNHAEIAQFADEYITDGDKLKSASVFTRIKDKISALPLLYDGPHECDGVITRQIFDEVLHALLTDRKQMIQTIDLYEALKACPTLRSTIVKHWRVKRDRYVILDSIIKSLSGVSGAQMGMFDLATDGAIVAEQ